MFNRCQDFDVFLFQPLYFYRGFLESLVLTQRNDSLSRYFSSQGHAGRELFDTGLGWHSELSACARWSPGLIQPCVGIKTGLLFICSRSHSPSPTPIFTGVTLALPSSLAPATLHRPRIPRCTGITTDLAFASCPCCFLNDLG